MAKGSARMSADERRESVVRAAVVEFARRGYVGTSTASIARRVGVSQPYLFRLFPDKRAIFLAAAKRGTDDIRKGFERVGEGLGPQEAHAAMSAVYVDLVADRDWLLFQMQMYVAVSVAEAAGDHDFGEQVRGFWTELWDAIHLLLGADAVVTREFVGVGMLINVALSMNLPAGHRVWQSCEEGMLPEAGAEE